MIAALAQGVSDGNGKKKAPARAIWLPFVAATHVVMVLLATSTMGQPGGEKRVPPDGLGYQPADGTTVTVNPPYFVCVPDEHATRYEWKVEAESTPSTVAKRWLFSSQFALFTPEITFEPGYYRWQCRILSDDQKTTTASWSRERRFYVPPDAPKCPRPPFELAGKAIPSTHPRWLVTADQLGALRAPSNMRSSWTIALLQDADRLLSAPLMKEPRPWSEGKWNADEWLQYYREIVQAARCTETLAFAALLTRDAKYQAAAKKWLLHLASWDPRGPTSLCNNDEQAMHIMFACARAYTWLYDVLTEPERARVREMLGTRARDAYAHLHHNRTAPYEQCPYNSHNGRLWHFLGEVAIVLYGDVPEAQEWLNYALTIYYGWYPIWGGRDGGWAEGMHYFLSYHEYVLPWLWQLEKVMKLTPALKPFYYRCSEFLLAIAPPGGALNSFGDFSENPPSERRAWVAAGLAALTGDERAHWLAEGVGLREQELTPLRYLAAISLGSNAPRLPSPHKLYLFPDTGLVAYHSNLAQPTRDVQWMMRANALGNLSHSHCDQLGIVVAAFGDPLFVNTGYRDYYGSPFCREWYWHTRAHNALLIGGEGQRRGLGTSASLVRWEENADLTYVIADATPAYGELAKIVQRYGASLEIGDTHVLVVLDDVWTTASSVTSLWHTRQRPKLSAQAQTVEFETTHCQVLARYFSNGELSLHMTDKYTTKPAMPPPGSANAREEWHISVTTETTGDKLHRVQILTLVNILPQQKRATPLSHVNVSRWGDEVILSWQQWQDRKPTFAAMVFDTKEKRVRYESGAEALRLRSLPEASCRDREKSVLAQMQ